MTAALEKRVQRLEAAVLGPMDEILSDLSRQERSVLRIMLTEELATRNYLPWEQRVAAAREVAEQRMTIASEELTETWNRIQPKLTPLWSYLQEREQAQI